MAQPVSIKGTKSGIILVLDKEIPFEELVPVIAKKFKQASGFLGQSDMGLLIRGKRLSDEQISTVLELIAQNSKLNIVCILDEDHPLEEAFTISVLHESRNASTPVEKTATYSAELSQEEKAQIENEAYRAAFEQIGDANARIHMGNIRSGQEIVSQHSIIVFGDVNPGGSLVSAGCIFVFGSLMGNAFAGAFGDTNAFVMATDFHPLQIRIADAIAVSANDEGGKSGRMLGRTRKDKKITPGPEVATYYSGQIARSAYNKKFQRSNQFFK